MEQLGVSSLWSKKCLKLEYKLTMFGSVMVILGGQQGRHRKTASLRYGRSRCSTIRQIVVVREDLVCRSSVFVIAKVDVEAMQALKQNWTLDGPCTSKSLDIVMV